MGARTGTGQRSYPRAARVSALLQQVVADELERLVDEEDGIGLLTVTGVQADRDCRNATVLLASISERAEAALEEWRPRLQAAIARQVRLKFTPHLRFRVDPAIVAGIKVEEALKTIDRDEL
jgi:ribosome-binding factor A